MMETRLTEMPRGSGGESDKLKCMVDDINNPESDHTVFNKYSRWDIYSAYKSGKIALNTFSFIKYTSFWNVMDDCKISE